MLSDDVRQRIDAALASAPVVLFMKGSRRQPQCGFSATVVRILDELIPDYETVDVLADPAIREGIKAYSSWPTIPQLYVKGEFLGGCDIVKELYGSVGRANRAMKLAREMGTEQYIQESRVAHGFALAQRAVYDLRRVVRGGRIADENKDVMYDVEKAIRLLRADMGALRLSQIIEKGFFIESHTSLPLQLCDLCAFCLRRMEEEKAGLALKPLDANCIPWAKPLIHRGAEPLTDVLTWLQNQQQKERPGT